MKGKMKTSRKQLLGTLLAAYAVVFLFVGVNRATGSRDYLPPDEQVRVTPAQLDSYTDFTRIVASGDFDLVVVRGDDWMVDYQPPGDGSGGFSATQAEQTLFLEGFGNRRESGRGRVTVSLPVLDELTAEFHTEVSVSDFDQRDMIITARNMRTLTLSGNTLDTIGLNIFFLREIRMVGNSIANEQLSISSSETLINRQ